MNNINNRSRRTLHQYQSTDRAITSSKEKVPTGSSSQRSSAYASSSSSTRGYSSQRNSANPRQASVRPNLPTIFENVFNNFVIPFFTTTPRNPATKPASKNAPPLPPPSYAPTTRIVSGWDAGGCVVDAVAGASGKKYEQAREVAIKHGFRPQYGWYFGPARDTLSELGKDVVYHPSQPRNWEDFPQKAIVGVKGKRAAHAVILKGDYIYDNNKAEPVHRDNYELLDDSSYIEFK